MSKYTINAELIDITPDMASELLRGNDKNFRNISDRRVDTMAKDMIDANWELNGETIKIAVDGTILDGQHRLNAIIKSGITIQMLVVRGLSCEGRSIDRGQTRTVAQWLSHLGIPSASRVSATVRTILSYQAGQWGKVHMNNVTITDSETIQFAKDNLEKIQDSLAVVRQKSFYALPIRATVAFVASEDKMPSKCKSVCWFFNALHTGVGIGENDAVFHLRNRWIKQTASSMLSPFMQRVLVTQAWNRDVAGMVTTSRNMHFKLNGPYKQQPPTEIFKVSDHLM
jgi:hypothetical protein